MCFVNFWVGSGVYLPLYLGHPRRGAAADVLRQPADRAARWSCWPRSPTVLVAGRSGVLALALFALIAVLPQSALTYAARTRPVGAPGSADRDPPLLARARAAPRARPRRAPPPRARGRARLRPPRGRRRPDRLRPPDAARPEPRELGGRPRRRVVERRRRPGRPARPRHARDLPDRRGRRHLERADGQGRPAAQPRRGAGRARERVRHAVRPARSRGGARGRGRGARLRREPAPEPRLHALRLPAQLRRLVAAA